MNEVDTTAAVAVERKTITTTAHPLTVIGEVAVGVRPADDPEFKAAARLLLAKFQKAPALAVALETVTL